MSTRRRYPNYTSLVNGIEASAEFGPGTCIPDELIADDAITADKIANDAITRLKMANLPVGPRELISQAVDLSLIHI